MKKYIKVISIIAIVVIVSWIMLYNYHGKGHIAIAPEPTATVSYACDADKTISAVYYDGPTTPPAGPNMPPTPGGSVKLVLSDGRSMTLAQTISADGTRYANPDESFVFWGKGNSAIVLENNVAKTYTGCVLVKPDTGGLTQIYQNGTNLISLRYPAGFTVDENYKYQEMGPGKDIYGTKFTIPTSMSEGTNLSSDSYISIETLPKTMACDASLFNYDKVTPKEVTDNDTTYSMASTGGAGAGNRYNETIYAIPGSNPCIAIRYFVHYGVFENYPAGSIKEFDNQALMNQFDTIRRTLVIN